MALENWHSTGYILNVEWHKEHTAPKSFLEGKVRPHIVDQER